MIAEGPLEPIPSPPKTLLNAGALPVNLATPVQSLISLARQLGPIFQLDVMGTPVLVVCGHRIAAEIFDEARFDKSIRGGLEGVRAIAGDGLFTAHTHEPNWSKAHNILLPYFGSRAMEGYYPKMLDIAGQLMLKWERLNPDDDVDVVHDMTALTLDTIGLCGFGYRFNSFYRESNHPFVDALIDGLEIVMSLGGLPVETMAQNRSRQARFNSDTRHLYAVVDQIVSDRKQRAAGEGEAASKDMLDYMLAGVDRRTGERLDDENIRYQIITFLIAGHETTSGLLSFVTYFLLKHPDVFARAAEEVDRVLGADLSVMPTMRQINALTYVQQIIKEALRLWPPVSVFARYPYKDDVLGGKFAVKAGTHMLVLLPALHRDPEVWGENPEQFDPDRFAPERERALPPDAYKPFGTGQRACIGRQFATQEAALVLGMLLQRFELIDHENYQLRLKETMTIKPDGLKIRLRPRSARGIFDTSAVAAPAAAMPVSGEAAGGVSLPSLPAHGTPLLVLFGSNLGTAEEVARRIADLGTAHGFATRLGWLDDYAGRLPVDGAVLIVSASYNGTPPDNAAEFCRWLGEGLAPDALAGVRYAVFGCGNRNWASTYQSIPRFIDEKLAAFGARRLFERGEGDAQEDLDAAFRSWRGALWPSMAAQLGLELGAATERTAPRYTVEVLAAPPVDALAAAHGAATMRIDANRELQRGGERSTRHVEIALPPGVSYRVGDHLGVLGENPPDVVARALGRFAFAPGAYVRLRATTPLSATLPVDDAIPVEQLLSRHVELQHTATRGQIETMASFTSCPNTRPRLEALAAGDDESSAYRTEVKAKRRSVLDLLEDHPACELPFDVWLDMLPLMTPRYYSIASSPRVSPEVCSITVGVVREPAWSGRGTFEGVCSTDLQRRAEGTMIDAFVKESKSGFHLPDDPMRPIVMIGPGSGIAPFRGFLQERAASRDAGASLGRALLFFGCRHPDRDFLYRDELERYAADGLVELHVAFSRLDARKTYVQQLIAKHAAEVWSIVDAGGTIYVCGDGSRMEPDVRATFAALYRAQTGGDDAAARRWLDELAAGGRYNLDVWGTT